MVEDCCGAYSPAAHDRAVASVSAGFGLVITSTQIVRQWSTASVAVSGE
jgi:hypothetical protein